MRVAVVGGPASVLDEDRRSTDTTDEGRPPAARLTRLPDRPAASGRWHDLVEHLVVTMAEYRGLLLEELVRPTIAWSVSTAQRLPRKSIKLGSYAAEGAVVRIHPALDQAFVPAFFVRWIIFHELLHHRLRDDLLARRGPPHPPHFRALERLHPRHDEACDWERRHVARLLAWRPRG